MDERRERHSEGNGESSMIWECQGGMGMGVKGELGNGKRKKEKRVWFWFSLGFSLENECAKLLLLNGCNS